MKNLNENNLKQAKSQLVDLRDVKIDQRLTKENRIKSYIKQVKNPYLFKVGDTAVRIRFTESGPSFEEKLLGIIRFYDRLNHY